VGDVNFGEAGTTSGQKAVGVPRSAVQMIGAKQVVFVVIDKAGVFAQREVSAGPESDGHTMIYPGLNAGGRGGKGGGHTMIYAGLNAGERVVTEGSFLLRAESLKLDPSQLTASKTP